jgi:sodium/potassium/calcium exchanger 6
MCDFNGNNILWGLFLVFVIIILFKFICSTIDEFVSPGIVYLSEKLQLSEALAGVTLLAFANGAGDVVTAIVASNSKDGISYNVGALYGAGFFVLTLVVAFTILLSPVKIVVSKSVIFRDIGFYILATLMTLFMAYRGEISEHTSLFMLFLYLVYVLVVVIQDRYEEKNEEP